MHRIILADDQVIFRAGTARVLALEDDMRIVAQCDDLTRIANAVDAHQGAILLFSSSLQLDVQPLAAQVGGIIGRSITAPALLDCVRRVARGQKCLTAMPERAMQEQDTVGARVRDRLTPKEMQIVALIVQGCKNKDIANQLGTKEQVIKNYLRSIYDKIGVSDRLELALFTLHHKLLAEAAHAAGNLIQMKNAS